MERLLKWFMVVLLTLRAECSLLARKPASSTPYLHLPITWHKANHCTKKAGVGGRNDRFETPGVLWTFAEGMLRTPQASLAMAF
jgi:hypothetical protein